MKTCGGVRRVPVYKSCWRRVRSRWADHTTVRLSGAVRGFHGALHRLTSAVGKRLGAGLDRHVLELSESTFERKPRLVGPGSLHHLEALGEPGHKRLPIDTERQKFRKPPPDEIPSSTRPWLSRSTAVTAAARWSGSCKELTTTATPSRSRSVQAAAYANSSSEAMSGVGRSTAPSPSPPRSRAARPWPGNS